MGAMTSQITGLTIFTQPSIQVQIWEISKLASLASVRWIPRTNAEMFPFDGVIMSGNGVHISWDVLFTF